MKTDFKLFISILCNSYTKGVKRELICGNVVSDCWWRSTACLVTWVICSQMTIRTLKWDTPPAFCHLQASGRHFLLLIGNFPHCRLQLPRERRPAAILTLSSDYRSVYQLLMLHNPCVISGHTVSVGLNTVLRCNRPMLFGIWYRWAYGVKDTTSLIRFRLLFSGVRRRVRL